jgi:hypothetical protein
MNVAAVNALCAAHFNDFATDEQRAKHVGRQLLSVHFELAHFGSFGGREILLASFGAIPFKGKYLPVLW